MGYIGRATVGDAKDAYNILMRKSREMSCWNTDKVREQHYNGWGWI